MNQPDLFEEPDQEPSTELICAYHCDNKESGWHAAEFINGELTRVFVSPTQPESAAETHFCDAKAPGDRIRPSIERIIEICVELNERLAKSS